MSRSNQGKDGSMSWEGKIINGVPRKIYKLVVHRFTLGDVDDPDLHAAEPMYKWEQSEAGQYIMSKAVETPIWQRQTDAATWSIQYCIIAKLYEDDASYFTLKYK